MAIRKVTKTIFITSDDQEWADEAAAEAHENRLALFHWMHMKWSFLMGPDVDTYAAELLAEFNVTKKD